MRKRVNAGALVTAGRAKAAFKSMAGLSVCVSTVSFGLHRRGFGLFGKLGRQNVRRFIGRALFNGGGIVGFDWGNRFSWSFCRRALCCAVLNDDARAVRPSMAMMLRRELSPPAFVVVVNYRRHLIASRVSCASERKLFFSSARWGCGPERGRGLAVRAITSTLGKKNGILIFGRW